MFVLLDQQTKIEERNNHLPLISIEVEVYQPQAIQKSGILPVIIQSDPEEHLVCR